MIEITLDSNNPMHKLFVSERPTIGHFPAVIRLPKTAFSDIFVPDAHIIFRIFGFRHCGEVVASGFLSALNAAKNAPGEGERSNNQRG